MPTYSFQGATTGISLLAEALTGADYALTAALTLKLDAAASEVAGFERAATQSLLLRTRPGPYAVHRLPAGVPAGRMTRSLRDVQGRFPFCVRETPAGTFLLADGMGPMLRWDPTTVYLDEAGVPAPVSTATDTGAAYVRYVDSDGNPSDLAPVDLAADTPTTGSYTYSNVPVPGPTQTRVARRQLLRPTAGEATTYYVDIDTDGLFATTFVSTRTDADLATQEAVPLLDDNGVPLADSHAVPPSWASAIESHLGRIFGAVPVAYAEGHAEVTFGSATVRGVATAWPAAFVGRTFSVAGVSGTYAITAVDVASQALTIDPVYGSPSDLFAPYAVEVEAPLRRTVAYSESLESESWPAINGFTIQADNDDITGLMRLGSFLYVLEKRHIHQFTFKDDPATDGGVFQAVQRGCLNNRLWVQVEDVAFMLDEAGVHTFAGGSTTPLSQDIQDLFDPSGTGPFRLNFDGDTSLWHAVADEPRYTIRWFVALTGSRYPRHALAFNYREQRWWIEEYRRPVLASATLRARGLQLLLGADHREVLSGGQGTTDGIASNVATTVRGAVTRAAPLAIWDSAATFAAESVNLAVAIVAGRGAGQWRRIVAVDGTRLEVDRPWLVRPDATSTYQIGGIGWTWDSGYFRYAESEADVDRTVELFTAAAADTTLGLEVFYDRSAAPATWAADSADDHVTIDATEAAASVDLAPGGRSLLRLEGHRDIYASAERYVGLRLAGEQALGAVRIYRLTLNGVVTEG